MTDDEIPRVEDYVDDVRYLTARLFVERHGEAFLVHRGLSAELRRPGRAQPTLNEITAVRTVPEGVRSGSGSTPALPPGGVAALAGRKPKSSFLVFEVRSTGRCPFPNMISVGRTRNNDIVISDVSVSKFHAFFTRGKDGGLYLQDSGSRNGTLLGGVAVAGRDAKPTPLRSFSEL